MDNQLSFSSHILSISKKAFRQSALISRCFISKNSFNLKLAFCTYVRPIVQYASQVWSPHIQNDIYLLENVQRRFTKSIPKLHYLPYTTRLTILHLPSLSCRRDQTNLCTVYRILHHHTCFDPSIFFFSFRLISTTRGHPFALYKPYTRLDTSKYAFHSRVIDPWNALPETIVSAGSISAFRARLKRI